jgi:hypothetical protein
VWRRHCRALLRKHVLPLLYSPLPRVNVLGHVVSIPPGYSEALLALDGAEGAFRDFTGVEGGGMGNSGRCDKGLKRENHRTRKDAHVWCNSFW